MDFWIDWNCQLFPSSTNGISSVQDSLDALELLGDRCSLGGFCLTSSYDRLREPISVFLLRQSRLSQLISEASERRINLCLSTQVLLSDGLSLEPGLEKLLLLKSGYLPVSLPISSYEDWIDAELNRLLYQNKLHLLFTSFERYLILYPRDVIEKLLRIPSAAFQFNYKSLCDARVQEVVKRLLDVKALVLFGTALNQVDKIYFYEQDTYLEVAKEVFTPMEYQKLLHMNRLLWND